MQTYNLYKRQIIAFNWFVSKTLYGLVIPNIHFYCKYP